MPQAVAAFTRLRGASALDARAAAGTSSVKEMLRLVLGDDAQRQQQFVQLQTTNAGDPTKFWTAVGAAFGAPVAQRLRLDGQLAYLTLDNAPLVQRLHAAEAAAPLTGPADLVARGYFRANKWMPLLDANVPSRIPGNTPDAFNVSSRVLMEAAEKKRSDQCLPVKTFNNIVNGQITWRERELAEGQTEREEDR